MSRTSRSLNLEPLEDRRLLSADGILFDRPEAFPMAVEIRHGSLIMTGGPRSETVTVRTKVARAGDAFGQHHPPVGSRFLEVVHEWNSSSEHGPGEGPRVVWVPEAMVDDSLVFYGREGRDIFNYDTERRELRVIAFGGPGDDTLNGGENHDILVGGSEGDLIASAGGAYTDKDTLNGRGGHDLLIGGPAIDNLFGDNHNDRTGNDYLIGGSGEDTLRGWAGDDLLFGGDFLPELYASDGVTDHLYGYQGRDYFFTENEQEGKPAVEGEDCIIPLGGKSGEGPPYYMDWLEQYHSSLPVRLPFDTHINAGGRPFIDDAFPGLKGNYELVGRSDTFNCHANTLRIYTHCVTPSEEFAVFDGLLTHPKNGFQLQQNLTKGAPIDTSIIPGVEKVVLYGKPDGLGGWLIKHSSRQLLDGSWLSKNGHAFGLIRHDHPNEIAGEHNPDHEENYGQPLFVYTRQRPGPPKLCQPKTSAWRNELEPADVNASGAVDIGDLLAVVNWLRKHAPGPIAETVDPADSGFIDVDGDRQTTLADALSVIAHLRAASQPVASGEGEEPSEALDSYARAADRLMSQFADGFTTPSERSGASSELLVARSANRPVGPILAYSATPAQR